MRSTHALIERARAGKHDRDDARPPQTAGAVGQRSRRPPTRAVVGGLLVALAAVGAFVLGTPGDPALTEYVVAAHAIDPGARFDPSDLRTTALDLPPDLAALAYTDAETLAGRISLGPIAAGQLVQAGGVAAASSSPFEVSLALEGDRALDSRLASGEHVAVLATYGSGPDAETLTMASSALVERISKPTGLAVGTADVVTLGLQAEADAQAVVHAARAGELTLVRTDAATAGASYRPPLLGAATDGL